MNNSVDRKEFHFIFFAENWTMVKFNKEIMVKVTISNLGWFQSYGLSAKV